VIAKADDCATEDPRQNVCLLKPTLNQMLSNRLLTTAGRQSHLAVPLAGARARRPHQLQPDVVGRRAAFIDLYSATRQIHFVSQFTSADDAVPPGPERGHVTLDPDARRKREAAAGAVIRAFGEFVIGGNYVVGVVIFLILLAIQFLVVNHGAVRSSAYFDPERVTELGWQPLQGANP
jgi:hypothetical protein